jgi:hypothetical protein
VETKRNIVAIVLMVPNLYKTERNAKFYENYKLLVTLFIEHVTFINDDV